MTHTKGIKNYSTEEEKTDIVKTLKTQSWERCVTLTTRTPRTPAEVCDFLIDFTRRIGQRNGQPFKYWFGLSYDKRGLRDYQYEHLSSVHVHGVLGGVSTLTNKEIEQCWKSRRMHYHHEDTGVLLSYSAYLGFPKVVHYDGDTKWLYYCLNQTPRGEIFTNIEELRV